MINLDGIWNALEPRRTGKRGRPEKPYVRELLGMAHMLAAEEAATPTEAATYIRNRSELVRGDANSVIRLVRKHRENPGILADAKSRLERQREQKLKLVLREVREHSSVCSGFMINEPSDRACELVFRAFFLVDDRTWSHPEVRKACRRLVNETRSKRQLVEAFERMADIERRLATYSR